MRTARQINARVLTMLHVGQSCAIENALFEGVSRALYKGRPTNRSPALRGCTRHGSGRRFVSDGACYRRLQQQEPACSRRRAARHTYTSSQMTYDLRRLRLHGLIARIPKSNTYKACDWSSSTPRSTTGCSHHYSLPINRRHHFNSVAPSRSSTRVSSPMFMTHALRRAA